MSYLVAHQFRLPPEQQALRDKCCHPSGTFVEFSREDVEKSIPDRFEKIVRLYPDRTAVKAGLKRITYDELNRAANRLADAIVRRVGGSNEMVVVFISQGIDIVTAILGVLKAGKCFVLADASWPSDRLTAILEHCQASIVVTNRDNAKLAHDLVGRSLHLLKVDQLNDSFSADGIRHGLSPETLGYLVYTSGSTGKPKGVFQNHRNILHSVMRRVNSFRIAPEDRLTLLSSGGHQAIMNILSAVLSGAAIFPFDTKGHDARQFADWLRREGITIYHSSASLFRQLANTLSIKDDLSSVRLVRSASEAMSQSDVELFQKYFSDDCILSNGMGSTETSTSTLYFMGKQTSIISESVPIGFPLDDMEIQVVDNDGREVQGECIGEIAVKSRYLALGYWRQPELTQAKFKPDPQDPTKRIYFTGDLGLMRADGCVVLKGRKDFRVKVRGYGVDIAEVENALRGHAAIREAIVVGRNDESGEARLIAYFTAAAQPMPTTSELRRFLSQKLPHYMIPSQFIRLGAIPRVPGGKVNRGALPAPPTTRPELIVSYSAPQGDVETGLARIWREVLCLDRVGIHDNFFDLGGHSLTASRVVSRVIQTFQLELPIKALFDAPTVAEMAVIITQHEANQASEAELAQMLREVEAMTEEEAQKRLA